MFLAYRFVDGSIDMLDQFMAAPSSTSTQSNGKDSTTAQTFYSAQNSDTPSLPQQTVQELHPADNVALPVVQQSSKMQSQDHLRSDAAYVQCRPTKIAVVHTDNLSYQQFVQDFMQPNLPVMIQVKDCHCFDIYGCLHAKPYFPLRHFQTHIRFLICIQSWSLYTNLFKLVQHIL